MCLCGFTRSTRSDDQARPSDATRNLISTSENDDDNRCNPSLTHRKPSPIAAAPTSPMLFLDIISVCKVTLCLCGFTYPTRSDDQARRSEVNLYHNHIIERDGPIGFSSQTHIRTHTHTHTHAHTHSTDIHTNTPKHRSTQLRQTFTQLHVVNINTHWIVSDNPVNTQSEGNNTKGEHHYTVG